MVSRERAFPKRTPARAIGREPSFHTEPPSSAHKPVPKRYSRHLQAWLASACRVPLGRLPPKGRVVNSAGAGSVGDVASPPALSRWRRFRCRVLTAATTWNRREKHRYPRWKDETPRKLGAPSAIGGANTLRPFAHPTFLRIQPTCRARSRATPGRRADRSASGPGRHSPLNVGPRRGNCRCLRARSIDASLTTGPTIATRLRRLVIGDAVACISGTRR